MGDLEVLDTLKLNFNPNGLLLLNITLGIVMFGVALGIDLSNFKNIIQKPKALILGLISQFLLLPAITFLLILILKPSDGVALGMILVASCPGGNISNFISSMAKANIELSLTLTGVSTFLSILLTPINFAFWGSLYVINSPLLKPIEIDFFEMFQTVVMILGIPLIIGVLISKKLPQLTKKIQKPIKTISIVIFSGFIIVALYNNLSVFIEFIHLILLIVFLHNALALLTGYFFARIFKLNQKDRKTISIETGIQNSGLALVLIFNPEIFPSDLQIGGMALIAAWWGIWHIVSGMVISYFWGKRN